MAIALAAIAACGPATAPNTAAGTNIGGFEPHFSIDSDGVANGRAHDEAAGEARFDRGTASRVLRKACEHAQSCYNGPAVDVLVSTTFGQDGSPTAAMVEKPLAVVGTLIAGCVEERFRDAHILAFRGESVTSTTTCSVGRDVPWECMYDQCSPFPASQEREVFPMR